MGALWLSAGGCFNKLSRNVGIYYPLVQPGARRILYSCSQVVLMLQMPWLMVNDVLFTGEEAPIRHHVDCLSNGSHRFTCNDESDQELPTKSFEALTSGFRSLCNYSRGAFSPFSAVAVRPEKREVVPQAAGVSRPWLPAGVGVPRKSSYL